MSALRVERLQRVTTVLEPQPPKSTYPSNHRDGKLRFYKGSRLVWKQDLPECESYRVAVEPGVGFVLVTVHVVEDET